MREYPPYWYWQFDRWNLLIAAGLASLALVLALQGGGALPVAVPAPTLSAPTIAVVEPTAAVTEIAVTPPAVVPTLGFPGSQTALLTGKPSVAAGTAAPGATVQLFDGDTLLAETTADADGKWLLDVPGLASGTHTLVVRATGADGVIVEGVPMVVTVSAPPVTPSVVTTPALIPSIEVPADGLALLADTPGELSGTAEPGAKVQVYDGDVLLGETTAGPDGKWQFALPGLAAGDHTLVARVTAPDGTVVESEPIQVEVPPKAGLGTPSIEIPADGLALTADAPGTLSGTAVPGAKVQIYDGDVLLGESTAGSDGKWQFVLPGLTAGDHTLVARVTAPDGTVVESEPLQVAVVPKAPAVAAGIEVPADGLALMADTPGTLSGTAEPGAKVQVYDGDVLLGETTSGPDGKWQFVLPGLAAGDHTLVARVTAPDGTVAESEPIQVAVAPKAPVATPGVEVPARGLVLTADTPFTLSGTAVPGAQVRVYDGDVLLGETTAGSDGKWQFVLPGLAIGPHTLVTRVTAPDGAVVEGEPLRVEVAPKAAVATPGIEVPADGLALTSDTPGVLSGTAEPGAKIQIYDGDVLLGETTAGPDGKWQLVLPGLAAGDHTLVVRQNAPDGTLVEGEPLQVEVAPRASELADYPAPYLIMLGSNQTIRVPVAGFCLNYGLPFPGSTLNPSAALPDAVRKGLAYAVQRGYTESAPAQTQLAIWYLAEGTRVPGRSYTIADEIIRLAENDVPVPEQGLMVPTLWESIESGVVAARVMIFAPTQPRQSAYSGRGTLVIENLTGQTQAFVVPYGVRFSDARSTGVQDMAILPLAK